MTYNNTTSAVNTLSHIVRDTTGRVLGMFTSTVQAKQYASKLINKGYSNITITS